METGELVLKQGVLHRSSGFGYHACPRASELLIEGHHYSLGKKVQGHKVWVAGQAAVECLVADLLQVLGPANDASNHVKVEPPQALPQSSLGQGFLLGCPAKRAIPTAEIRLVDERLGRA